MAQSILTLTPVYLNYIDIVPSEMMTSKLCLDDSNIHYVDTVDSKY